MRFAALPSLTDHGINDITNDNQTDDHKDSNPIAGYVDPKLGDHVLKGGKYSADKARTVIKYGK